jgi:hypothetical protein
MNAKAHFEISILFTFCPKQQKVTKNAFSQIIQETFRFSIAFRIGTVDKASDYQDFIFRSFFCGAL